VNLRISGVWRALEARPRPLVMGYLQALVAEPQLLRFNYEVEEDSI